MGSFGKYGFFVVPHGWHIGKRLATKRRRVWGSARVGVAWCRRAAAYRAFGVESLSIVRAPEDRTSEVIGAGYGDQ